VKRSAWTILSTVALANLLALLGFVGWLGATGRLSGERIEQLRAIFAETVAQEQTRLTAEAAEAEAAAQRAAEEEAAARPPIDAGDRLALQAQYDAIMQQRLARARETLETMSDAMAGERAQLDADLAAFHAEKQAFEDMRSRISAIEGDAQFAKALALYSSMKPKDAAAALRVIYDRGEIDQVVAYLDRMDGRKASKILAQFAPELAAGLLERLRTRGVAVAATEEP